MKLKKLCGIFVVFVAFNGLDNGLDAFERLPPLLVVPDYSCASSTDGATALRFSVFLPQEKEEWKVVVTSQKGNGFTVFSPSEIYLANPLLVIKEDDGRSSSFELERWESNPPENLPDTWMLKYMFGGDSFKGQCSVTLYLEEILLEGRTPKTHTDYSELLEGRASYSCPHIESSVNFDCSEGTEAVEVPRSGWGF